jgi:hypothetical protein
MELVPEAGSEPPAAGLSVEVPVGATEAPVGAAELPPALKEEEVGILQFEVSNVSPRAPSILRGNRSPFPLFHRQRVASHPCPCSDDGASLREDVAGITTATARLQ